MTDAPLSAKFTTAAVKRQKKKRLPPLSFRATEEERALLKEWAGSLPIGAYIRATLFGDRVSPRRRKARRPSVDQEALSKALALLGQSRLSSNLNQIAKAANMGALPISQGLLDELNAACTDVRRMREALIEALNLKVRD